MTLRWSRRALLDVQRLASRTDAHDKRLAAPAFVEAIQEKLGGLKNLRCRAARAGCKTPENWSCTATISSVTGCAPTRCNCCKSGLWRASGAADSGTF